MYVLAVCMLAVAHHKKAQEAAYNQKTEQLKAKSEGGGVAALRAKNELAQVILCISCSV